MLPSKRMRWQPGEPLRTQRLYSIYKRAPPSPHLWGTSFVKTQGNKTERCRPGNAALSTSQVARGKPSTCHNAETHTQCLTWYESDETHKHKSQRPWLPGFCSLPYFFHLVRYLREGRQRTKLCSNFAFSSFPGQNTTVSGKGVPAIHKGHSSSRDEYFYRRASPQLVGLFPELGLRKIFCNIH